MDGVRNDVPDDRAGLIQIKLWLDGSLPAGVATGPGGTARDFTGWVGADVGRRCARCGR
jgi:hypothetical protein